MISSYFREGKENVFTSHVKHKITWNKERLLLPSCRVLQKWEILWVQSLFLLWWIFQMTTISRSLTFHKCLSNLLSKAGESRWKYFDTRRNWMAHPYFQTVSMSGGKQSETKYNFCLDIKSLHKNSKLCYTKIWCAKKNISQRIRVQVANNRSILFSFFSHVYLFAIWNK